MPRPRCPVPVSHDRRQRATRITRRSLIVQSGKISHANPFASRAYFYRSLVLITDLEGYGLTMNRCRWNRPKALSVGADTEIVDTSPKGRFFDTLCHCMTLVLCIWTSYSPLLFLFLVISKVVNLFPRCEVVCRVVLARLQEQTERSLLDGLNIY